MHTLEPDHVEQESHVEPTPAEDITNPFPEQGKLWCIPPIFLDFGFAK
jgi:hypothetical protein